MDKIDMELLAYKIGQKLGLPHGLLPAVAKTESNWDHNAVSPVGARGLMQIMPGTARDERVNLKLSELSNPEKSLEGGARYLKWLLERTGGNIDKAMAAYNRGPYAKGSLPAETQAYIPKIKRAMSIYSDPAYLAPYKKSDYVEDENAIPEELKRAFMSRGLSSTPPELEIFKAASELSPNTASGVYTVEKGDTMSTIARKLGVPLSQLVERNRNRIADINKIGVGLKLVY